jgi:hypothetical protein
MVPLYVLVQCVCVRVRATFLKPFTALSATGLRTPFECTGEYNATARRAAVTRVRGGANLKCTFQIWAIFSHPCTSYRQLKFCVQSLLDGLCSEQNFSWGFDLTNRTIPLCLYKKNSSCLCWYYLCFVWSGGLGGPRGYSARHICKTCCLLRLNSIQSSVLLNSLSVVVQAACRSWFLYVCVRFIQIYTLVWFTTVILFASGETPSRIGGRGSKSG